MLPVGSTKTCLRRRVITHGFLDALRPCLLVGHHVGPFLSSPESLTVGCFPSQREICTVGKKLYCGNLSYNTSSSDLEQLFAEFGRVQSAEVIMDRDTGRSKGFGFV